MKNIRLLFLGLMILFSLTLKAQVSNSVINGLKCQAVMDGNYKYLQIEFSLNTSPVNVEKINFLLGSGKGKSDILEVNGTIAEMNGSYSLEVRNHGSYPIKEKYFAKILIPLLENDPLKYISINVKTKTNQILTADYQLPQ